MPTPTVTNFFGANATVLTANAQTSATALDPVLVIRYSDFTAEGWNALANGEELDPEKWVTAIVKKIKAWSMANLDDIPNVVITAPLVGLEQRNATLKRRYSYGVDIYQVDTGTSEPDPDSI